MAIPVPPLDPELAKGLARVANERPATFTMEFMLARRADMVTNAATVIGDLPVRHEEITILGAGGGEVVLSVFRRADHEQPGVGIVYLHSGGMIMGNRFSGAAEYLSWVIELDAVVVSVEYRLAPEHPDPAPMDDCFDALTWVADHAADLGFDPERLIIAGASAGGGLAAGAALRARDEGGARLAGVLLIYPMLDDRGSTFSSRQIDGVGVWDRASNEVGWTALLGARRATPDVSHFAAPARAEDLAGLPPTFLDVGSVEVFRDEVVAYADRIWRHGGDAELHVWPGAFHGFDNAVPGAVLSIKARATRLGWLRRVSALSGASK